nr:hypothetical protein [Tanacetum cinerariifolium]
MADVNVPAPASTRSDDQILPSAAWVPIGKSNFILDLQKKQKNPIFQIYVDILQNINFFRAFTASASLDETRFVLDANLLMKALEITPIDHAHQFVSPPSGDAIMDFVDELGRRYPILQMLWCIITSTNVDYAELMWEEFVQAIQTFMTDKANLGSPTKKGRKDKPHGIPYCRFTIICHLGRTHNIHHRSASPFHLFEEDPRLGNLNFVTKGEYYEVFGMPIPNELISNNIKNAPYYNTYLEMVANHDQKVVAEKGGEKKPATTKQLKSKPVKEKSSKPAPAPKPKVTQEKPKPFPVKHSKLGKNEGVTDWYKSYNYREQGSNLKMMSSPNHPTFNIKDAFSSNFLDFIPASSDYVLTSPRKTYSSSFNSFGVVPIASPSLSLFHNDPYMKVFQAFYAKESPIPPPNPITPPVILTASSVLPPSLLFDPRYFFVLEELLQPKKQIHTPSSSSTTLSNPSRKQACILVPPSFSTYTPTPPQIYELGKSSIKMRIKHHEEQIESILNYLEELFFTILRKWKNRSRYPSSPPIKNEESLGTHSMSLTKLDFLPYTSTN